MLHLIVYLFIVAILSKKGDYSCCKERLEIIKTEDKNEANKENNV